MGWVLFFDGDCAFCSAGVRRAMRFDTRGNLKFSPLQGKFASENGFTKYAEKSGGTMVLMREADGRVFIRSDAAIELASALGGWWRIFTAAKFIPRFLRDAAYHWVATHRYWLSRKSDFCMLPDPELEKRIIK